jgi:hypothetical protein
MDHFLVHVLSIAANVAAHHVVALAAAQAVAL